MEELFITLVENSIVLSVMAFAWSLAEKRARAERERVQDVSENYIEYLKQSMK